MCLYFLKYVYSLHDMFIYIYMYTHAFGFLLNVSDPSIVLLWQSHRLFGPSDHQAWAEQNQRREREAEHKQSLHWNHRFPVVNSI